MATPQHREKARQSYKFSDEDHVWVDRYIVRWPVGKGFVLDVPVPYHPEGDNPSVERQLRVYVNNIIVQMGKRDGRKGKPTMSKERLTLPLDEVPVSAWEEE